MDIIIWFMIIVGVISGIISTGYLVIAMPVVFIWKVYRKFRYHMALYD